MSSIGLFERFFTVKSSLCYNRRDVTDRLVLREHGVCIEKHPWFFEKIWRGAFLQKENKETWALFLKKISSRPLVEQRKIQKIFQKHCINVRDLTQKGAPLEKRHMDCALIALATVYVSDLGESPKKLTAREVSDKIKILTDPFHKVLSIHPLSDGFWQTYELVFSDAVFREKERLMRVQELACLKTYESYFEHLTKQVAARDLEEEMILPSFLGNDFYYIYKKINQGGLIAYAMKPLCERSQLKPVLFFRPTQLAVTAENAMETLMDDLHLEGVGRGGFYAAEKQLDELMQDLQFKRPEEKIIVGGFSLAGSYAQYFIAHKENWKHVAEGLFFNDPSVDRKTAQTFAQKINQSKEKQDLLSLSLFRTEGDCIDHGGEMHVGCGVTNPDVSMNLTVVSPVNPFLPRVARHMMCLLESEEPKKKIDLTLKKNQFHLDNSARGEEVLFWENLRRWLGLVLRPLFVLLVFVCISFEKKLEASSDLLVSD